ncbi:ankyrin-like protein [Variola virus]|uniref:Ankyrin-like protein n=1 Tax=Variola virus TaxID=10255 RepID=Q89651_VARV|nr:H6R [Variola virus]CAB54775.1 H6R protein [Variola minor virus]ABF22938.1 ankyrin-like protein [Variola virus]ABF23549.1 ankyrin-like protein [Variola virus]ABF24945.1 ankyrin-like protein [Variola virus]
MDFFKKEILDWSIYLSLHYIAHACSNSSTSHIIQEYNLIRTYKKVDKTIVDFLSRWPNLFHILEYGENILHIYSMDDANTNIIIFFLDKVLNINKNGSFIHNLGLSSSINIKEYVYQLVNNDHLDNGIRLMLENGRRTRHFLSYILDTVNIYICILINHGFYIDAVDSYGCTLLHRCIYHYKKSESESYNELIKILLNNGSDVDKKDTHGNTPFILLCKHDIDNVELFEICLENANIDSVDFNGYTPLHYVSCRNKYDFVKSLISKGANVNTRNRFGTTPFYCGIIHGISLIKLYLESDTELEIDNEHIVRHLIIFDAVESLDYLLFRGVIDINYRTIYNETSIYDAVSYNAYNMLVYLLNKNGDFETITTSGCTCISKAVANNNKIIMEVLLSKQPSLKIMILSIIAITKHKQHNTNLLKMCIKYTACMTDYDTLIDVQSLQQYKWYILKCFDEIDIMKRCYIKNKTVFQLVFCTKDINTLMRYGRHPSFVKYTSLDVYGSRVRNIIASIRYRQRLISLLSKKLDVGDKWACFPNEIKYKILENFNDNELSTYLKIL